MVSSTNKSENVIEEKENLQHSPVSCRELNSVKRRSLTNISSRVADSAAMTREAATARDSAEKAFIFYWDL